jgi:hypothetical protein
MPVTSKPPATPPSGISSPTDAWTKRMIQTQIEVNNNPALRYQLSKRGF